MKNRFLNSVVIISFVIILFELLLKKNLVFTTVYYSLDLWIKNLLPSLFPFFIVSDILVSYDITSYIPKGIKRVFQKIFNISEYSLSILFLSMVSGFPSNARITKNYYDSNLISLEEANHILSFTHFSNPVFVLSTVAVTFFDNPSLGIPILFSHYLSNFIIGIIIRNKYSISYNCNYTSINKKSQNFGKVLTDSIKKSIDSLLLIFGTLTFFLIISSFIIELLNLNLYNTTLIKCILEITIGLKSLSLLNIGNVYKIVIASMALSFGGFSIHMQVISQISDTDISYLHFFIARIFQAIISGVLAFFIYYILY